ncbi:hypothetical protein Tco_0389492 [Tanacetum coccineum]
MLGLKEDILSPYTPTSILIAAVEAAENITPVVAHEEAETIHNMTTENKLYFQAEKEAIFLILNCNPEQARGIRICKRTALPRKVFQEAVQTYLQTPSTFQTPGQRLKNTTTKKDTDEEIEEQELKHITVYIAKISGGLTQKESVLTSQPF